MPCTLLCDSATDLARSFNEIPISDRWAAGFMRIRCRWGRCADGGFACSNVGGSGERFVSRGCQGGTVGRRRIRPASDGQSRGEGEWRGTDGPRLAARNVRAFPLRETAWRLPEEGRERDPAGRAADDHLRRAGVSGGGAAEDDDCAGAHHSRRTQFQRASLPARRNSMRT
jgi:hypothetical protein